MKINELRLQNFINHANTEISFERVNVFVGPNGAGKTTILNGIEWALTGSCRGMAKKKDAAGIIRHGAKSAEAWLEFDNGEGPAYYIDRRCTPSNTTLVFGRGDSVIARGLQEAQEKIYEVLGITAEIANVLFDVFALPQLTNIERKKIIQSVMATEGTDALANYLTEKGFGGMPKDRLDDIMKAYQEHGLGNDNNGAYGYAVQMRRAYKRQLDDIPKSEPPALNGVDGLQGKKPDELGKAIDQAEAERDELLRVKAYDAGQVDSTKESIRLMEAEITRVNGQIEEMEGAPAGEGVEAATKRMEEAKEALAKVVDEEHEDGSAKYNLRHTLDTLTEMGDVISQKSLKAVGSKLNLIETESQQGGAEHVAELKACEEAVAETKRVCQSARGKITAIDGLESQNQQNNSIMEGLKADLAKAESSQGGSEFSPDQLAEKLGALETNITLFRTRLEQLTRYDEYLRSLEGIKKQEKALATKVASWDKLAETLNPKNPDLLILMGTTFGTFQELFRGASAALGVPAAINAEDFSIEVTRATCISPVAWLSHSEVYRVGIALQIALCAILGIRTAIIDEGETLFDECKQALSGLISAPSNHIDCFLLLATGEPQSKITSNGINVRGIKDGEVL